jgi:hypothetical protein
MFQYGALCGIRTHSFSSKCGADFTFCLSGQYGSNLPAGESDSYPAESYHTTKHSEVSESKYIDLAQLNGFLICSYRLLLECLCVWHHIVIY